MKGSFLVAKKFSWSDAEILLAPYWRNSGPFVTYNIAPDTSAHTPFQANVHQSHQCKQRPLRSPTSSLFNVHLNQLLSCTSLPRVPNPKGPVCTVPAHLDRQSRPRRRPARPRWGSCCVRQRGCASSAAAPATRSTPPLQCPAPARAPPAGSFGIGRCRKWRPPGEGGLCRDTESKDCI